MARRTLESLHVGINDFPGTGLDLRGCVNDALDWQRLLSERGFSTSTLLDAQATRERVLYEIEQVLGRAGDRGSVIITVSSHGTQVPVTVSPEEPDALTEAIVGYDFQTGGLITDDDLWEVLAARPTRSRVTLIVDTCHAGTMNRSALDLPYPRSDQAARYLPPISVGEQGLGVAHERVSRGLRDADLPVPLLAACAPEEVSWDTSFGGRPNGAFSYYAIKAYRDTNPRTLRAWAKEIRQWLPTQRLPQTPRLDAKGMQPYRRPLT